MSVPTKCLISIYHSSGLIKEFSFPLERKKELIRIFEDLYTDSIHTASIESGNSKLMISSSFVKDSIITI